MIKEEDVRKYALSFEQTEEEPQSEKTSFRVDKRIFATLDIKNRQVILKLSAINQWGLSSLGKNKIYPVDGRMGKQGWTIFEMNKINIDIFRNALIESYCEVAPQKLAEKYK